MVALPPRATGSTWSNSRNMREAQRCPLVPTNVHRPWSRFHTARFTSAGMNRAWELFRRAALGRVVAANLRVSSVAMRSSSARSRTCEALASGMRWLSSARAYSSLSCVFFSSTTQTDGCGAACFAAGVCASGPGSRSTGRAACGESIKARSGVLESSLAGERVSEVGVEVVALVGVGDAVATWLLLSLAFRASSRTICWSTMNWISAQLRWDAASTNRSTFSGVR